MRKKEIIQKLDELSQNLSKSNLSQFEAVIADILAFFNYSREKLQSEDPKDREAALKDLNEVQHKLEDLSKAALDKADMDPEQLASFISNPNNFSSEDWEKLQHMSGDIHTYQKTLNNRKS